MKILKKYKIYQISKRIKKKMEEVHEWHPPVKEMNVDTDSWNLGREEGLWQAMMIIKEAMNGR